MVAKISIVSLRGIIIKIIRPYWFEVVTGQLSEPECHATSTGKKID